MPEHSPAPSTGRGVYGFALYLACTSAFAMYIIWAFIPDSILHSFGITYYPQKYWAVALPIYVLMSLALFAFFLYPALNQLLVHPLDSVKTFTDSHSHLSSSSHDISNSGTRKIPPAEDLDISEVCNSLYGRQGVVHSQKQTLKSMK